MVPVPGVRLMLHGVALYKALGSEKSAFDSGAVGGFGRDEAKSTNVLCLKQGEKVKSSNAVQISNCVFLAKRQNTVSFFGFPVVGG